MESVCSFYKEDVFPILSQLYSPALFIVTDRLNYLPQNRFLGGSDGLQLIVILPMLCEAFLHPFPAFL